MTKQEYLQRHAINIFYTALGEAPTSRLTWCLGGAEPGQAQRAEDDRRQEHREGKETGKVVTK